MDKKIIELSEEDASTLICFIKNHEREDIPDDVWDICMTMMDLIDMY